jgi:ubiquitin-protein ligase
MTIGLRLRRIYLDKNEIQENPHYNTIGIYYDALSESALVYGPVGSAYEHFPFFFTVEFPENYPFSPPALRCCTAYGSAVLHPLLKAGAFVEFPAGRWCATYRLSTALASVQGLLSGEWPLAHDCAYVATDLSMNVHYRNYVRNVGWIYSYSVASGERCLRAASARLVEVVRQRITGMDLHEDVDMIDNEYLPYCLSAVGLAEKLRAVRETYLNIKNTFIIGELVENAEVLSE